MKRKIAIGAVTSLQAKERAQAVLAEVKKKDGRRERETRNRDFPNDEPGRDCK